MAGLIVRKEDGSLLFDTQYISHGLIKSGYLQADGEWYRFVLRGINVDPNLRSSYNQVQPPSPGERMHSITVAGAVNPICFLVGKGTLQGTQRSGNTFKFYYASASTATKAYIFDLMNDNVQGTLPFLKCRRPDGSISFNSLQVPLNVAYSMQAPAPSDLDRYNKRQPYAGCRWEYVGWSNGSGRSDGWDAVIDIPLESNVEYASFLNFSRGCDSWFTDPTLTILGVSEGSYGRVGGISFMFGPAGETTNITANTNQVPGCSVAGLPADGNYPVALVVRTANLPFPFG
jgi:hypothetical protein